MQVSQVMTVHPVTVTPTQNVRDAAEIMKRIDTGFVTFVDGHEDLNTGSFGVVDGFNGLRHDSIIGCHHKNDDVGDLSTTRAHLGEGRVTRSIDEGDELTFVVDLIGRGMLGDSAGLASGHIRAPNGVE